MAFIRSAQSQPLLSGAGGIAGEGTPVGGTSRTTAGKPGGWYNIQEFLAANPQAPTAQQRIEQRGGEQLSQAKQQLESQQAPTTPTAQQYSEEQFKLIREGGVTPEEQSQLQGYLGQSFTPQDPSQVYQDIQSPFKDIQPGSFDSLMNWYGNIERPSATYTPGMQKMDELLLRGQKDFATQYPTQLQEQFQSQVTDPLQAKREALGQEQEKAKEGFEQAKGQWYEGIKGFLGGEKEKVEAEQQRQEAAAKAAAEQTPYDVMGDYAQYADDFYYDPSVPYRPGSGPMNPAQQYGFDPLDPRDYISAGQANVSRETAASSALTPEQMATYNALAGLMPGEDFSQYTGGTFDPGAQSFDQERFKTDYLDLARQIEQEKARREIDRLQGMETVNLPWWQTPEQAGLESYVVPDYVQTPMEMIQLGLPQAGETIWQPYFNIPRVSNVDV